MLPDNQEVASFTLLALWCSSSWHWITVGFPKDPENHWYNWKKGLRLSDQMELCCPSHVQKVGSMECLENADCGLLGAFWYAVPQFTSSHRRAKGRFPGLSCGSSNLGSTFWWSNRQLLMDKEIMAWIPLGTNPGVDSTVKDLEILWVEMRRLSATEDVDPARQDLVVNKAAVDWCVGNLMERGRDQPQEESHKAWRSSPIPNDLQDCWLLLGITPLQLAVTRLLPIS